MPWITPTLKDTRTLTRDYVLSQLGAKAMIPNSVLRIMSDAMAGLTHLTFLYFDWLAKQLMPDTAEQEWLDRHGVIWLTNADGSKGRKAATYAEGDLRFEGAQGTIIPIGEVLRGPVADVEYQTTVEGEIGIDGFGTGHAVALDGRHGRQSAGRHQPAICRRGNCGRDADHLSGRHDGRRRARNRRPIARADPVPHSKPADGRQQADYVRWAMAVPGVTRAWAAPEIGPGTMTVRFLMDDLYPENYGLPQEQDIEVVFDYVNSSGR